MRGIENGEEREGVYFTWTWNNVRNCWEAFIPLRVYPNEDGTYSASGNEVLSDKLFSTFNEAEADAAGFPFIGYTTKEKAQE